MDADDRSESGARAAPPGSPAWQCPGAYGAGLRGRVRALTVLLAWAAAASLAPADAGAQDPAQGIDVNFDYWELDGATGRALVTGVRIAQGELSITAEQGWYREMPQEKLIEWGLQGNVRIRGENALITADTAEFIERNGVLGRFELRGTPARFEDLAPGSAEQAFGEAERLTYDLVADVVSLSGEARIVLGGYAYVGCGLIYDIGAKAARSDSSECERPLQMIRITPSEDPAGQQAP